MFTLHEKVDQILDTIQISSCDSLKSTKYTFPSKFVTYSTVSDLELYRKQLCGRSGGNSCAVSPSIITH